MNASRRIRTRNRTTPRHRLAAAVAVALLAPALACAQEGFDLQETPPEDKPAETVDLTTIFSHVEFGLGWLDDDSFRFGRYSGLHSQGLFGVFGLDWNRRAPYDSADPTYSRLTIDNLGLDSRTASYERGRQGRWGVRVDYAQLPMLRSQTGSTPFLGVGSTELTLPANWVPAQTTAGMTTLMSSLNPVDIRHERRRFGVGVDWRINPRWDVSTSYRQEHKDGLKTIGAVIGNSGGNPRAAILPEPIDYRTREAEVAVRYADSRKQLELRYLVSVFEDAESSLTWSNPFSAINGWDASAGFPTGAGQLALPPDSQFHQGSAAFGYRWSERLRLSADLAFGRMTQDEDYLPYTINPVLAASITQPLPRGSLDGRIDTTVANVHLSGQPTDRFHWSASAHYDDRDNKTPRDEYVYIGGDSQLQDTTAISSRRRFNEPYSFREMRWKLDAGYRFGKRTQLSGSVERRDTDRTYSEREEAAETTWNLTLRHAASDWFTGSLRIQRANRDGSTYHGDHPFLSGYDPGYTDTIPGGFENPPGLRKYYQADRTRDRLAVNLAFTPGNWNFGLDAQQVRDDYDHSELGLQYARNSVITIDAGYAPSENWSVYAFHTWEHVAQDQAGVSTRGGTRDIDVVDPTRLWWADHRDRIRTTGAGLDWKAKSGRLDLGLDYVLARSNGIVNVVTGSSLLFAPLPPNRTRLASLGLRARYRLADDLDLHVRWWNESYRATDFALDGVEANQLANVILLGEDSEDYDVNVVTVSFSYRF
jgi:MtrB/PioB family decaheme-associated outer membrane protein